MPVKTISRSADDGSTSPKIWISSTPSLRNRGDYVASKIWLKCVELPSSRIGPMSKV